jgi:hypothetical protein
MKRALVVVFAFAIACHHSSGDPNADKPSSCVIEHDGGVTQCFEDIGATAKSNGEKVCGEMHGEHTFRANVPCPVESLVGACRKRAGTDLERVERCYHDAPACEARCKKSEGVFEK